MGGRSVRRRGEGTPYYVVLRLVATAIDAWDDWTGSLALSGIDVRAWDLNLMLNALEASIARGAEDEKKAAAEKRKLYAPPKEEMQRERAARASGGLRKRGLTPGAANALMAAIAAQDGRAG